MDKYEDEIDESIPISRTVKNQDMYKDVYLNNTLIDIDNLLNDNNLSQENEEEIVSVSFDEDKSYDVNDYLDKAYEKRVNDNLKRSLENTDCEVDKVKEKKDEISKLIESIEKKDKDKDLFVSLLPDNNDTVTTDPVDETKLDSVIDEEIIYSYTEEERKINVDFNDVEDKEKRQKNKKLPIIIFVASLVILIIVILIIFLL